MYHVSHIKIYVSIKHDFLQQKSLLILFKKVSKIAQAVIIYINYLIFIICCCLLLIIY